MVRSSPDIGGIVRAIVIVVAVLLFGWLLLAWAVVKRPILALPVAAFTGLVLLVGMHDAQGSRSTSLLALWIWRRAHRASFDRLVGRRLRSPWVRWWTYERRWRNTMLLSGLGKRTRVRESGPEDPQGHSTPWCDRVLGATAAGAVHRGLRARRARAGAQLRRQLLPRA